MWKKVGLLLGIVGVSLLHYLTPVPHHAPWHALFQRLYYVPIILGAYWFGFRWGLLLSLLSGLVYAPHVFFQWSAIPMAADSKYVEIIMFVIIASLVGTLSDFQKLQQKKLLETTRQLHRMDRLSLLGQLAAGLAHEIRNPLGSLIGSDEILAEHIDSKHPAYEFIGILRKEHRRLRDKLNEFLSFAKPSEPQLIPNQVNDVVRSTLSLVAKEAADRHCSVLPVLDEHLPFVPMDAAHLQQVLLNLLLNGIQAMPEGGTLTVETRQEKHGVALTVHDEGSGIPAEAMERIFDPFYSTGNDGTGLGLAIVKQLTESMNGTVTVASGDGGTSFTIRIPDGTAHDTAD